MDIYNQDPMIGAGMGFLFGLVFLIIGIVKKEKNAIGIGSLFLVLSIGGGLYFWNLAPASPPINH